MRSELVRSARAGESIQRTAERLLDADDALVHLPRHVQELRDAARAAVSGDLVARRAYEQVVNRWARRVDALGQGRDGGPGAHTMRSSTQRLITELREAQAGEVDRIVDRWVLDRARYQARQIARHETVEAYRDAYQEQAANNPAVVGFRWQLSPQHPRPDICDLYANQNLYGLGPGGYPPDAVPDTPHPNCLCTQVAIVDRYYARRQLAIETGRPEPPREWEVGGHETAADWLAKQPEDFQRQLLGRTRYDVFRREPGRVVTPDGRPVPVHQVLGLPPRARRLGSAVAARPIVEADREAGQVLPFPELAPAEGLAPSSPARLTPEEAAHGITGLVNRPDAPETHAALHDIFGPNIDPATLNRLGSLPPGFRHEGLTARLDDRRRAYVMSSRIVAEDGTRVGEIMRTLTRRPDGRLVAKHDLFKLEDAFQGQGIASHVLRQQLRSYDELGVSEIQLSTAWNGRYVWAKMGFEWDAAQTAATEQALRGWLVRERGLSIPEARRLAADVSGDPWSLARAEARGVPFGEDFLMSQPGWDGRVDLTPGSQSRQRYTEAIRYRDGEEEEQAPPARRRRRRRR